MIIGFTGTRSGMTDEQRTMVALVLTHELRVELHMNTGHREFHHGDCIGADTDAVYLAWAIGYDIIVHPPQNNTYQAFMHQRLREGEPHGDQKLIRLPSKSYLERNHDIVDCCEFLIVCPSTVHEVRRSGTWATFRYAHWTVEKEVLLILPDGEVHRYRADGTVDLHVSTEELAVHG